MSERVQLPFAALRELQQKAETTWGEVTSSVLHGPRTLEVLTGSIEEQLQAVRAFEDTHGTGVASITETAIDTLKSAHKECSDQFIDRWVEDIATRAIDLRCTSSTLSQDDRMKRIRDIRGTILDLRENHTLDDENRQYLRFAETLLQQLETNTPRSLHNTISKKQIQIDFGKTELNLDLAETLCEMSHLFFLDKVEEALAKFSLLPQQEQKEVISIVTTLGSSLDDLTSDDEDCFLDASMAFARASMARSNRYAQNGEDIPDEGDIALLFEGGY